MKTPLEFRELIKLLQAGDESAVAEAYRRFGPVLRVAVRRRLNDDIRSRFDTLDFVQDVWATFLTNPIDRDRFPSAEALIGFLCQIARNKVTDVVRRRYFGAKDSVDAEIGDKDRPSDVRSHIATPSQWAIASEEFESLVGRFPAGHQVIVRRLGEGYTNEDIARMSNVSLSTVNRVVRRLKELTGR